MEREQKIILFSGVHGVGKGYYLKKNFDTSEDFTILEASSLIKRYLRFSRLQLLRWKRMEQKWVNNLLKSLWTMQLMKW